MPVTVIATASPSVKLKSPILNKVSSYHGSSVLIQFPSQFDLVSGSSTISWWYLNLQVVSPVECSLTVLSVIGLTHSEFNLFTGNEQSNLTGTTGTGTTGTDGPGATGTTTVGTIGATTGAGGFGGT